MNGAEGDAGGATVDLCRPSEPDRPQNPGPTSLLEIGRLLRDRYRICARLGSGGRGTVYKVHDRYRASLPEADQYVALKVLHAGGDCSDQMIEDLRRELHCGQALSHPNIVNVFELDRDGDLVFFTMEFLDGELLSDVLHRVRPASLQRRQAMQIIRQLAAGLAHAHERGVVHGDLKPRNIFITRSGQLRILDFGAAQRVARRESDDRALLSGTPAYASCEMLEGRPAEPRDDVYALACICYQVLSGVHPFANRSATVARDFGVKAIRPAGLTGRQWRTLQTGLSWHRAGRSLSVHVFMRRLTDHITEAPMIPLQDFAAADGGSRVPRLRAAAASAAVLVIAGICVAELRDSAAGKMHVGAVTTGTVTTAATAATTATATGAAATGAATASPKTPGSASPDAVIPEARAAAAKVAADNTPQVKPSVRHPAPALPAISVDGYHVSTGDRFVEIRVHRNIAQKNVSFAWWTEAATAKDNVDYVQQGKAIQTFSPEQRTTRFYVKLLPESGRSQRDFFYVAIVQPGQKPAAESVKRVQIWLPPVRDHLQASR